MQQPCNKTQRAEAGPCSRTPLQDAWVGVTAPAAGPEHREGLGPWEGVGCFVSHR